MRKHLLLALTLLMAASAWGLDLSNTTLFPVTAPDYKCKDGDYFKGTGIAHLVVPNNASIILDGVDLTGGTSGSNGSGIYLEGNGYIQLINSSKVTSGNSTCSAIYVKPGYTLYISECPGNYGASLDAECCDLASGKAAGIGAGYSESCGNIVINTGIVTAKGGRYGAGIGGAQNSDCGDITIGTGVTKVEATRGISASCAIGKGYGTSVKSGKVTICGVERENDITDQTYTYTPWDGDLWNITEDKVALDGTTIYGWYADKYRIFIAPNATVTLQDAEITCSTDDHTYDQNGLTCLGNATIKLQGRSTVKGADYYAGIYVPKGKTVTIEAGTESVNSGSGALYVTGGESGAGLGAGSSDEAGNIVINSGYVVATGGSGAAGIGCGNSWQGKCGNITISSGVHMVKAIAGEAATYSIGRTDDATCGTITIGGQVVSSISKSPYQYPSGFDLSQMSSDYTIQDGITVYGTLDAATQPYKLSIAADANVIFNNVKIVGVDRQSYSECTTKWAGVTCVGNATIELQGDNNITSFYSDYPAIFVPSSSTLALKGEGKLNARPAKHLGGSLIDAAAIGAASGKDGGNIRIDGGTIYAEGGSHAAAIGGARDANCGSIMIYGGRVFATGGYQGAAIGGSYDKACGGIFIDNAVSRVVAVAGYDSGYGKYSTYSIGKGDGSNATCGVIMIGGQQVSSITDHRFIYPEINWDGDLAKVNEGDVVAKNGTIITGTFDPVQPFKISIADGATVYLRDADIEPKMGGNKWATLDCEGDATIVLEGENKLSIFNGWYPCIYVPAGKTLTIKGEGSLEATYGTEFNYGPVIGAQSGAACGNIIFDGGKITAISWSNPAIGAAMSADCGNITITKNMQRLYAVRNATSENPSSSYWTIGKYNNSTNCGTITIGGVVYEDGIHETPYVYEPDREGLTKGIDDAEKFYSDLLGNPACSSIAATLLDAIRAAEAVYVDSNATVAEVEKAIADLAAALDKAEKDAEPYQGIEDINIKTAPSKVMIDGTLYIIRDAHVYDATGTLVK
jgi:hypothetical protein